MTQIDLDKNRIHFYGHLNVMLLHVLEEISVFQETYHLGVPETNKSELIHVTRLLTALENISEQLNLRIETLNKERSQP